MRPLDASVFFENRVGMVDLTEENSNTLFEVLQDWEAQLEPHKHQLLEMEL